MPKTLDEVQPRTVEILDSLPVWYSTDPIALSILDAMGKELQRIEDFITDVLTQFFPSNTDDTYGLLSMWEQLVGLGIAPADMTLEQRRALVAARLRDRTASSGLEWEQVVAEALREVPWTYEEGPSDYQVTITYPFLVGGMTSAQVQALVRAVTPAHLQVLATYTSGFLLGISLIGDPL